jgi:hypothetical protein
MTNYEAHMNRQVLQPTTKHPQKTSTMLIDSNPSLWAFFIIMAGLLSGPALYVFLYLLTHTLVRLFSVVDEEQQVGIPLETLREISL